MQGDIAGWDIGGAHLKAALVNSNGAVVRVVQRPCPLWRGLEELRHAVAEISREFSFENCRHAVTMTGELVDLFPNRAEGVVRVVEAVSALLGSESIRVYAGEGGFLRPEDVNRDVFELIASANWLASATLAAFEAGEGLFIDIGSTTTDILTLSGSKVMAQGFTDYQRLCSGELVYTGVVRTPVMAVADSVVFEGREVGLMAEHFATMADAYRLTGELDESHDQMPAADGGEKTVEGSARRLARMIGCDFRRDELIVWRRFAVLLREKQLDRIQLPCERLLTGPGYTAGAAFIGAGIGRFLVKALAQRLDRPYRDFDELFPLRPACSPMTIADCAPAVSVAVLAGRLC
ncbi:MAG: hydantoinase/oxoprolinase family protein [Gammaproteobacteria bacterium]